MADMGDRRSVTVATLEVCENGHVLAVEPAGEQEQVRHTCGQWTWLDGNYCVHCGAKLEHRREG